MYINLLMNGPYLSRFASVNISLCPSSDGVKSILVTRLSPRRAPLAPIAPQALGISSCKKTGFKWIFMPEERAEAAIYPLKIFERFWWPYTKRMVEAWHAEGLIVWFHLDQCWDLNIPYFKELPKSSVMLDLDGLTDIFAAKEISLSESCAFGSRETSGILNLILPSVMLHLTYFSFELPVSIGSNSAAPVSYIIISLEFFKGINNESSIFC